MDSALIHEARDINKSLDIEYEVGLKNLYKINNKILSDWRYKYRDFKGKKALNYLYKLTGIQV